MRMIVLLAFAASTAASADARRAVAGLPLPPRGLDYVETVCSGGIDARYDQVRVLANGQVQKASRRSPVVQRAFASRAELRKIWRELDFARFERRVVPPEKPYVMDGIDCSLARTSNGQSHVVLLMQQMRDKPRYRDLEQAIDDINALGRRATGAIMRLAS
jgi:hypothetical protein